MIADILRVACTTGSFASFCNAPAILLHRSCNKPRSTPRTDPHLIEHADRRISNAPLSMPRPGAHPRFSPTRAKARNSANPATFSSRVTPSACSDSAVGPASRARLTSQRDRAAAAVGNQAIRGRWPSAATGPTQLPRTDRRTYRTHRRARRTGGRRTGLPPGPRPDRETGRRDRAQCHSDDHTDAAGDRPLHRGAL